MKRGIVPILRPWQLLVPLPKLIGCKTTQVRLHTPIDYLSLPIRLGMVCSAAREGGAQLPEKFRPEMAKKDAVTIRHNRDESLHE